MTVQNVCEFVKAVKNYGPSFDDRGAPLQRASSRKAPATETVAVCGDAAPVGQHVRRELQAPPAALTSPTDSPNLPRTVWKIAEEAGFLRPSYADCRAP